MNCEEATYLLSQGMDCPLGVRSRVSLRAHTLICVHCRSFRLQLSVMRQAAKKMAQGLTPDEVGSNGENDS